MQFLLPISLAAAFAGLLCSAVSDPSIALVMSCNEYFRGRVSPSLISLQPVFRAWQTPAPAHRPQQLSALSCPLLWGLINIYSSQLGREMSGRGAGAIVTEGSETLTSQQDPSFPTGTQKTKKPSNTRSVDPQRGEEEQNQGWRRRRRRRPGRWPQGPEREEEAFEKESGEGSPLRAVYTTDHQRNSQDNGAERIHNSRQSRAREKRRCCYEYTRPLRASSPTYPTPETQ